VLVRSFDAMHTAVEDIARKQEEGKLGIMGSSTLSGNEHVGPPSAPLPAGGVRDLDLVYSCISIDDMEVDCVHRGRYTVVRQLARPLKQMGITALVEDLEGTSLSLLYYSRA